MVAIILGAVMLAIGFVLLLIGGQFKRKEAADEVTEEEKQYLLDRLEFYRRYQNQTESEYNMGLISDEEYERETAYVNAGLDEAEGVMNESNYFDRT